MALPPDTFTPPRRCVLCGKTHTRDDINTHGPCVQPVIHPATFNKPILAAIAAHLPNVGLVLDPFVGVGTIYDLVTEYRDIIGVEIEPPLAALNERTTLGSALDLPFDDEHFDAIATSPCLAPEHRILTADLRWVAAGDLVTGDRLLAFDETASGTTANGHARRRQYQWTEVVSAVEVINPCVRVHLSDGSSIITTPNHPWLGCPSSGYSTYRWTRSDHLKPGAIVLRQFQPWESEQSYEAGWLAGIWDGEGSLSQGEHGAPKLVASQKVGTTSDQIRDVQKGLGIGHNLISRSPVEGRLSVENHYVTGGFPGILEALGRIRPQRLLEKWKMFDLSHRCIQPERVEVLAVEPVGIRPVTVLETTTGTYFGEGYLHHNCYGNRMSDHHDAKDGTIRRSYTHDMRRWLNDPNYKLDIDNSGKLHWGALYRNFHIRAWREAIRVLRPGGVFILNVKDFYKAGERQHITDWHIDMLTEWGLQVDGGTLVGVSGMGYGANRSSRVQYETVARLVKG